MAADFSEARDAGLSHALVVGRHTPGQHLPNDTIHAIVAGQPELIGISAVYPALQGEAAALAEVERAVKTLGLAGIDLRFNEPAPVARVAQAFPRLRIVAYHGWRPTRSRPSAEPFARTTCWACHPPISPRESQPGSQAYVEAANGFLGDQLRFGPSYPFRPIGQSIDDALALGLSESVVDRVLYGNAARRLGIGSTPAHAVKV